MDDLIDEFIAETREMLEALGGELVAWEAAPDDRGRLDEIFRFVHTVKGNCGFFDLPRIKALSHAAEDALAAVRSGTRSPDAGLVSAVLAVLDRIGELVQALESGEEPETADDEALIALLSGSADAAETEQREPAPSLARSPARTIRLPVELLDRMMSGVSDLVLARNELARRLREAGGCTEVEGAFERVSATLADLRDAISRTRMQRIESLFAPLPRMVRDLADETGKLVSLEIDGGDVEIDREMIEMIRDPLTHIVRNAVDHGIEAPAERRAGGKLEAGLLCVCARQAGNQILIEVKDDGRGIDSAQLVSRAVAAGAVTREGARQLSETQKLALIFQPGLSTAAEVTSISGRGVGMDVVRSNIEKIGGLVDVDSRDGEGVRLTLRVPLTLTIIPALTVGCGGRTYALPRSSIEEIVRVKGGQVRVESVGGASVATIRGRRIPLLSLPESLGCEPASAPLDQSLIILRPAGGDVYALAVDEVHDHEELVVKPAAPTVMATGLYAGTTIADDGRPILLLDPPGIAARAGLSFERRSSEPSEEPGASRAAEAAEALLFRMLDGGKRLVPLAAVQRIEEVKPEAVRLSAGRLNVAVGESIMPLEGCGDTAPHRPFRLLRLTDGLVEVGYGFDEVVDVLRPSAPITPSARPGEVRGLILIAGEQIELLDLHWLFSSHAGGAAPEAGRPLCTIPAGDAFFETILRPLVESAGYRVVASGSPGSEEAAIAILNAEADQPIPSAAARIVRLRAAAEPEGEKDDSIHRYDRAALIAALGSPAAGSRRHG